MDSALKAEWVDAYMHGLQVDIQMDGLADVWTDGQMDKLIDESFKIQTKQLGRGSNVRKSHCVTQI